MLSSLGARIVVNNHTLPCTNKAGRRGIESILNLLIVDVIESNKINSGIITACTVAS